MLVLVCVVCCCCRDVSDSGFLIIGLLMQVAMHSVRLLSLVTVNSAQFWPAAKNWYLYACLNKEISLAYVGLSRG